MKHLVKALLKLASMIGGIISVGIVIALFVAFLILPQIPKLDETAVFELEVPFQVFTQDEKLIGEFGKERRIPLAYEDAPRRLVQAILAAEDDGFFEHPGIDIKGIVRALIANIRSGQTAQGASTITMQVARNFFLSSERTYSRKLNELFLALSLEKNYSKEQILEFYLNKIFLGHRSYGFAAASKVYYDKPVNELDLAQLAMLAGLPKAPSQSNPVTNPQRALKRRNYVLGRMRQLEFITADEFNEAANAELTAKKYAPKIEFEAPYMAEMVRRHLYDIHGEEIYGSGYKIYTTIDSELQKASDLSLRKGLVRYDRRHGFRLNDSGPKKTVLKPYGHLQTATVVSISDRSAVLETSEHETIELNWDQLGWSSVQTAKGSIKPGKAADLLSTGKQVYIEPVDDHWRLAQIPKIAGAIVSLNPNTGAIKALSGGFDFNLSKFNRVTQAKRQAGSNIKPFIYSAALEKGYKPASKVSAEPLAIKDESLDEGVWLPGNYTGKFYGYTSLRKALSKSLNLVSVRLLNSIGIQFGIEHLSRFNFDPNTLPRGLSLALGSADVTPLQMVSSYSVFANGGYRIEPYFIERIVDRENHIIEESSKSFHVCAYCLNQQYSAETDYSIKSLSLKQPARLAIPPANAYVMNDMLKEVVRSGTATAAQKLDRKDIGGKTGTTNDFKDAWFSGFNKNLVTSVWVGFDQPRTLGKRESATRVALPIWIDYMDTALKNMPEINLVKPDNVRQEDEEVFIVSNRPEFKDKTFVLDTIQKETEEKAEGLF